MGAHNIPFGAALPVNIKQATIHATNGCVVFTCHCGDGPILLASFDSVVECRTCKTRWRLEIVQMRRNADGNVEVGCKLGQGSPGPAM